MLGRVFSAAALVRLLVVLLAAGGLQLWASAVAPSPASADGAATGVGGQFVPVVGRLLDTRNGTGGVPVAKLAAGSTTVVQVTGRTNPNVPTSGISAVQVALTAISPAGAGDASLSPHNGYIADGFSALVYDTSGKGNMTNTVTVALGKDGAISLQVTGTTDMSIDLEGYYTTSTGQGFVPLSTPAALIDSRSSLGIAAHPILPANTYTVGVAGVGGVPSDATAVVVNFEVFAYGTASGFLNAYPADQGLSAAYSFPSGITALGGVVQLGSSGTSAGKIKVVWQGAGTIDVAMAVVGYFVGNAGPRQAGMFTPGAARVLTEYTIPASTAVTVPVAGVHGVPLPGSGIGSVAVNMQVIHHLGTQGIVYVSPDDRAASVGAVIYQPDSIRSNLATVALGADGGITVNNGGPDTVQVTLDVEGWYYAATGPVPNGQTMTQKNVTLQGSKYGGAWVTYKYRVGTSGAFTPVTPAQVTDASGNHPSAWPVTTSGTPATYTPYTWDISQVSGITSTTKTLLQLVACYGSAQTTADASLVCSTPFNLTYAPSDFGANHATTVVGPGSLSLLTGDYEISATDAAAATSIGGLSLGRTLTTLAPAAGNPLSGGTGVTAAGVFGPGWAADLTGPDAGDATYTIATNLAAGYLTFTDTDGGVATYQATTTAKTTFAPVGDDASTGTLVSMPNASTITMADPDGTITTWTLPTGSTAWQVASVVEPGAHDKTSYTWNNGVVTRIFAPAPTGVTCTDATADTTVGCRSLVLVYNSANTRLLEVDTSIPQTSGQVNKVAVAHYDYDTAGRLVDSYDPRISPHLTTSYGYDASNRLTTLTEPGQNPWTFTYDTSHRLSTVSRTVPVTATDGSTSNQNAVSTIVYDVPLSGTTGLPALDAASAATWHETGDLPTGGTAIFSPDHKPSSSTAGNMGTADWAYATLHYLDVNGREVNTATYGAGQWLIDTTQYDTFGNDIWDLDAANRAQAITPTAATDPAAKAAATTAARADLLATSTVYNSLDPAEVTDTFGPAHPITLSTGAVIDARSHTSTSYDEGAPNGGLNTATGQAYRLPTTALTAPYNLATAQDAAYPDRSTTTFGYAAVGAMSGYTGWSLGQATTSTVRMAASASSADLTTTTVYDADGRTIGSWLPGDTTGATPRATTTTYYTATGTGTCVNPAAAGLVCQTAPGGQPASDAPLPVTTLTYDQWGDPLTATQAYGSTGTTRTATTTYDTAGRPTVTATTVVGVPGDNTALPAVTVSYDPTTGQVATKTTGSGSTAQTLTSKYDAVGQLSNYTDATGNTTTTGYDIDSRPTRQADVMGAVTLAYDGNSGEHRGLVTSEDIGTSTNNTFSASYDAAGNITQIYPGGITSSGTFDNAGNQTALTYKTATGATLAAFTQTIGATGTGADHVVAQASTINSAAYSHQAFTDDAAGRLINVTDTLQTSGTSSCTTRVYGFDTHSNRTSLKSYPAASGGGCSTTTTPATTTYGYDAADRLTGGTLGAETYDVLGRVSLAPASEATGIGSHNAANGGPSGALSLGYFSNDMVATQAQGSGSSAASIAFGLDPEQDRVSTQATSTAAGVKTLTNHYDDASDETAWTSTTKTDGTTVTKRYLDGIDGNLAATVTDGTVKLDLTNLHGDTVATIDPAATTISSYHETTEYGLPRDPATAADDYGWLGGKKRSSDDLGGLTLMGVRLYNPATARFLSVDPVPGGNPNAYTYPTDPINGYDLNGMFGWRSILSGMVKVAAVAKWVPGPIGTASDLVGIGDDLLKGDWQAVARDGVDLAAQYVGGKIAAEIADKIATKAGTAIVSKVGRSLTTPKHKKLLIERAMKKTGEDYAGKGLSAAYTASVSRSAKKQMHQGLCRKAARKMTVYSC
jgi:RHS repeat-associated protein